jgi:outer membrane protein assembly factor BamA
MSVNSNLVAQELTISSIAIAGNTKTKEAIIVRELPFQLNQKITKDSLDLTLLVAQNQLVSLNLFNQVSLNYTSKNDSISVSILVVEKWYIWPIPTLEFADRNFNQWWDFNFNTSRINYGLYNFVYNLGGLNHTLKLSLIAGYTKNLGLEYRIPYLDKRKHFGVSAGIAYKTNHEITFETLNNKQQFYNNFDTIVNKRTASFIELNYRPGLFFFHKFFGAFLNQKIHPNIGILNPDYADGQNKLNYLQLGYQLLYRKVDNRFYPINGQIVSLGGALNFVNTNSTKSWMDATIAAERYAALSKRFNFGIGANVKISSTQSTNYPLNTALGYKQFVRGYEPYVIDGQQYLLFKSTVRYALFHQKLLNTSILPLKAYKKSVCSSYFSFFVDGGQVKGTKTGNNLTNTTLIGIGLGWDWVFYYDKVIRFEYSINKDKQQGLYIHFTKPL